jgi:hypothetical protein
MHVDSQQFGQEEVELDMTQREIIAVFDRILELSLELFKIEDIKMQLIISGQFSTYLEMIFRMRTDRFR